MVLVMHHVLADGIGGLATLAQLVDGATAPVSVPFPQAPPSRSELFADAVAHRLTMVRSLPRAVLLMRSCTYARSGWRRGARSTFRPDLGVGLLWYERTWLRWLGQRTHTTQP